MHVMVHWTINDLPSYTNLSGWATYGELAYPVCQMDTHYYNLKDGRKCSFIRGKTKAHPKGCRVMKFYNSWSTLITYH